MRPRPDDKGTPWQIGLSTLRVRLDPGIDRIHQGNEVLGQVGKFLLRDGGDLLSRKEGCHESESQEKLCRSRNGRGTRGWRISCCGHGHCHHSNDHLLRVSEQRGGCPLQRELDRRTQVRG